MPGTRLGMTGEERMNFSNKHVIVTGGTGALGAAVVDALLKAGASCTIPSRRELEAPRFAHRDSANVTLVEIGDLADETAVARLYAGVAPWASIHIAGGFAAGKLADTDKSALMAQINGNLVSCFLCCRAAVNAMQAAGNGGRIVNVAARPALEPRSGAGMTAYTIAKSGVATLTIALAEEVAKDGILVNAVAPSIMDTPANRRAIPKANFDVWPKVEEVAATILFLASPENRVSRGAVVPVYGRS
jgi:NAD(P)-dependent dehydrogenase (short-subunit alcohol dehydrogenase family)